MPDERSRSTPDDGGGGRTIGFRLPPIRLPPITLPDGLRLAVPPPGVRGSGSRLLAAVAVDLIDAAVVLSIGGGPGRVLVGTLLAVLLVGPIGLIYAWEAVGLAVPFPVSVVPSATPLVLVARYRRR